MVDDLTNPDARELRAHALSYPETHESFPWGHRAFKVRTKSFLFMSGEPGTLNLTVKLPHSHMAALALPFAEPAGYGLGKSGWVTARFSEDAGLPVSLLAEWIDESFRAVAPKTVVAMLDGGSGRGSAKKNH